MKKNILIIFLTMIILSINLPKIFAANNASQSAVNKISSNSASINQQIDTLQQRIASKVAQLNLAQKKGFIGTVNDANDTEITITDVNGNLQLIDVDEFTKFSSDTNPTFGISDIKKGAVIGILGIYNKDSKRTLARFVTQLNLPTIINGTVTNIDNKNYIITVTTIDGKDIPVYIQDLTRNLEYSKDQGLVRSGFSKINLNERILAVGFPDKTKPKQILATRFIDFPDLAVNPKIPIVKNNLPSVITSTPSAK